MAAFAEQRMRPDHDEHRVGSPSLRPTSPSDVSP
jgi:hypothetical protein